jgi:membrane-bound lytic murein transglycosylase B
MYSLPSLQRRLRWTVGLLCLSTVAIDPATAQSDPLAPLPDKPAPLVRPVPIAPAVRPVTPSPESQASATLTGWSAYKLRLAARARAAGVREATISATIPTLTQNARVTSLDRAQPGGPPNSGIIPPFAPYRREHVSRDLITRGAARFRASAGQLRSIEQRYGVDPAILLAIFGHETSYGDVVGTFDLVQVLATLAYEGRRRDFFESELIAALQLIDRGTPRSRLKGSWAGATGFPQFMPSSVLRLARDGDGDGAADIWNSQSDALASIANYLRDAGWKPRVGWGVAVQVPAGLDRAALRTTLVAPRCPTVYRRHSRWLTLREWRALGVQPTSAGLGEDEQATLIEPDGPGATGYLLTSNYRAILDYNCSNFYALAVGLLADGIRGS